MKLHAFAPLATYPEANSETSAAHLVSAAAALDAKLHVLALNAQIPDVSNALSKFLLDTPRMVREAEAESRDRGEHLLGIVRDKAQALSVACETDSIAAPITSIGEIAGRRARYFDLTLLGWEAENATSRAMAESVIFECGRPVLLLPELSDIGSFDHVAIAWDGSQVAARAVADARIFLERATRISVLTVVDEKPLDESGIGEKLAAALLDHNLPAQSVALEAEDCPIAETLQQEAISRGCKLLVMGGYGHSRMRDFVLGGATEGVLSDLLMPVLLSH